MAQKLFVSRTAISKWELGKGYPSIDSLKEIAKFFDITIDELLSGNELLTVAEQDTKQKEIHFRSLVFGLLDSSIILLLFLPFFAINIGGAVQEGSILSLTEMNPYLRIAYIIAIVIITFYGILTLSLQNCSILFWTKNKCTISLILNSLVLILFIISSQPYASVFVFIFFLIKVLMMIKKV